MEKGAYCFEVSEAGQQGLQILDYAFNPTTQRFLTQAGIQPGMRVLEVGCGLGVMSAWLADAVGPSGHVDAIDIFEPQVRATQRAAESCGHRNVTAFVHSVYELDALDKRYDFILCRFVLIHLSDPVRALTQMQGQLTAQGKLVCEEGLVSQAFRYPHSEHWATERSLPFFQDDFLETQGRDGNYGRRLYHDMHAVGFQGLTAQLVQPLLTTAKEKALLLIGHEENKGNMAPEAYESQRTALMEMVNDPARLIAFYQSCQVLGVNS